MNSFTHEDLTIEVAPEGDAVVRLDWTGRSNAREPAKVLGPYLEAVLREASERGETVEMHFERIDHFNSSTVTALIELIRTARRVGCLLAIVYDRHLKWQRLSFEALGSLLRPDDLVTIREAR